MWLAQHGHNNSVVPKTGPYWIVDHDPVAVAAHVAEKSSFWGGVFSLFLLVPLAIIVALIILGVMPTAIGIGWKTLVDWVKDSFADDPLWTLFLAIFVGCVLSMFTALYFGLIWSVVADIYRQYTAGILFPFAWSTYVNPL